MNKNKMLRLASVLLILTLLTTSIIGGTFAKYVTTDQGRDTARVAKFGVVATVSGDLFGSTYAGKTTGGNTIVTYSQNDGKVSAADDTAKIVAPGTENKAGLTLSVSGTPEVSTQVKLGTAKDTSDKEYTNSDIYLKAGEYGVMVKYTGVKTDENIGNYYSVSDGTYSKAVSTAGEVYELCDVVKADDDYYPLNWYVNGVAVDRQTAIVSSLTGSGKAFAEDKIFSPNKDNKLSATVGWEWIFQNGSDEKDTILGDMISAKLSAGQSGPNPITVVKKNAADGYDAVKYKNITSGASTIQVAYTGNDADAPSKLEDINICACLTASFGASITVEQVD